MLSKAPCRCGTPKVNLKVNFNLRSSVKLIGTKRPGCDYFLPQALVLHTVAASLSLRIFKRKDPLKPGYQFSAKNLLFIIFKRKRVWPRKTLRICI